MKKGWVHQNKALMAGAAAAIVVFLSCDGTTAINPQKIDVVTITDINSRISEADMNAGVLKTNNFVDPVKMSHVVHEREAVKCVFCHHLNKNDDRVKQCAACHKGIAGRDLMHDFCIECHLKAKEGPVMCQDCH